MMSPIIDVPKPINAEWCKVDGLFFIAQPKDD